MEVEDKGNKLDTLQRQLDDLRRMNLKVFRLSKLKTAPGRGLLDSGATHPLRPRRKKEDLSAYPKVHVALAGGQEMEMALAPTGVIVGDYGAEPIIPMGMVTSTLGCQLTWNPEGLSLIHPIHGNMKIEIVDGCPLMSAEDTLKLIKEIEENKEVRIQSLKLDEQVGWEEEWLRHLAEEEDIFGDEAEVAPPAPLPEGGDENAPLPEGGDENAPLPEEGDGEAPQPEEGLEERKDVKITVQRLIEEMTHAVCEEQAALDVVLEAVAKLRQAAIKPSEAEEVLQTRIVSQQEVRKKAKEWGPAIMSELTSLFEKKGALQKISAAEGKRMLQEGKAEALPA
eukprot:s4345_g5.t1